MGDYYPDNNATSEMHLPVHTRFDAQEPCRRFSRGLCTDGERCRYAHVIGNVRDDALEPCRRFSRGQCTDGERCRYAHVIGNFRETEGQRGHWTVSQRRSERVNFCNFFVAGRPCPYGSECRYLHEDGGNQGDSGMFRESRESSAISIVTNNDERRLNRVKSRSSNDPPVHQNQNAAWVKTKLCLMWENTGSCWYGSTCTYAHGNAELRNVDYPNSLDTSRGHDFDTASKNAASKGPESGTVPQHDKPLRFRWTDIKKISQVYADWIDDELPSPDASDKDGN